MGKIYKNNVKTVLKMYKMLKTKNERLKEF